MENNEKCLWKVNWIQEENHACQFTDVKEGCTSFDYLDGELWFSSELKSRQLDFKITLVATDSLRTYKNLSDGNIANLRIHPNLLYITRYEDAKKAGGDFPRRLYDQESRIPLWRVELKILDGEVDWWTESEAQPGGYYQHVYQMDKDDDGNWILPLQMLRLVVVTPLQRTNATGIKIREALQLRRAMYEEIDEDQWDKLVRELERFYKKDGKPELDRYCLQFDVTLDPGSLLQTRLATILSDPIQASKTKTSINFDLLGTISHEKSCTQFQRTTHLFSRFPLSALSPSQTSLSGSISGSPQGSAGQLAPEFSVRFVIRQKQSQEYVLDKRLNQPGDVRVEPMWLEFEIPIQHDYIIKDIYKAGNEIYLEGYRPKDKYRSKTKVKFHYQTHQENSFCMFCSSNPDKIGLDILSDSSSPFPKKRSMLNGGGDHADDLDVVDDGYHTAKKMKDGTENDIDWDEVDTSVVKRKITQSFPRYSLGSLIQTENLHSFTHPHTKQSPKKNVKNGNAKANEIHKDTTTVKTNGTKKQDSIEQEEAFVVSPRRKPASPNLSSFFAFIIIPSSVVMCLFLFNKDFPSFSEIMKMFQFCVYLACTPMFYLMLEQYCNLTQLASTVLAFGLCFTFMQLCTFLY